MRGMWAAAMVCLWLVGCLAGPPNETTSAEVVGGNPQRGWTLVQSYGCHTCHAIPGIPGQDTYVGPPLTHWASRHYIAGSLVNEPDHLILWLVDPQSVEPGTAMPDLGVTEQDARDISAYLFMLEED